MKHHWLTLLSFVCILFAGCQMLEENSTSLKNSSDSGSITIQFPVPERSVITFDKNSVDRYLVELSGISTEYSDSKTADSSNSFNVSFTSLDLGNFKIKISAFSSNTLLDFLEKEITVNAGSNSIPFVFSTRNLLNNSSIVTSQVFDPEQNLKIFKFKTFTDDQIPTNNISSISSDSYSEGQSESTELISFAEIDNGNIYYTYIDYYSIFNYNTGTSIGIPQKSSNNLQLYTLPDCLYYDVSSKKLYNMTYSKHYADNDLYLSVIDTEENTFNFLFKINTLLFPDYSQFISFAVYDKDLFVAYERDSEDDKYCLAHLTIENGTMGTSSNLYYARDIIGEDFAEISDLQIIQQGELYVLVRQVGGLNSGSSAFDYNALKYSTNEAGNKFYSRGSLVKLSYTENYLTPEKYTGWYGNKMMRTLKQNGISPCSEGDYLFVSNEMKELDVYGPSYSENQNYFYGPKKIICVKPKELYIVDCGMAVRLADWKKKNLVDDFWTEGYKGDENTPSMITGMTSNIFYHTRIVKINLADFALDVQEDLVTNFKKMAKSEYTLIFNNILNDYNQKIDIPEDQKYFGSNIQDSASSYYLDIHPAASENPEDDNQEDGLFISEEEEQLYSSYNFTSLEIYAFPKKSLDEKFSFLNSKLNNDSERIENFIKDFNICPIEESAYNEYQIINLGLENFQLYKLLNMDMENVIPYLRENCSWENEKICTLLNNQYFSDLYLGESLTIDYYREELFTAEGVPYLNDIQVFELYCIDDTAGMVKYVENLGWNEDELQAFKVLVGYN